MNMSIDDSQAIRELESLQKQFNDTGEAMQEIGILLDNQMHNNIDSMGDGGWPPPKKQYNHPLLRDTGNLYNSIFHTTTNDSVTVSDSVDYAPYQALGTDHIPARDFMYLEDRNEQEIEDILAKHLLK